VFPKKLSGAQFHSEVMNVLCEDQAILEQDLPILNEEQETLIQRVFLKTVHNTKEKEHDDAVSTSCNILQEINQAFSMEYSLCCVAFFIFIIFIFIIELGLDITSYMIGERPDKDENDTVADDTQQKGKKRLQGSEAKGAKKKIKAVSIPDITIKKGNKKVDGDGKKFWGNLQKGNMPDYTRLRVSNSRDSGATSGW